MFLLARPGEMLRLDKKEVTQDVHPDSLTKFSQVISHNSASSIIYVGINKIRHG